MGLVVTVPCFSNAGHDGRLQDLLTGLAILEIQKYRLNGSGQRRRHGALHRPWQEKQRFRSRQESEFLDIDGVLYRRLVEDDLSAASGIRLLVVERDHRVLGSNGNFRLE